MTTDTTLLQPTTFKLILVGIREDVSTVASRDALGKLFKLAPEQAHILFGTLPYVLKKQLGAEPAFRYKAAIESAGGICHLEEENAGGKIEVEVVTELMASSSEHAHVKSPALGVLADFPGATDLRAPKAPAHGLAPMRQEMGVSGKIVAELRNFLLLDIPERSIALNFKLPSPSVRAKAGSGSSAELYESKEDPLEFLKLLNTRIKFLNFAKLSPSARLRANGDLLKIFYPTALPLTVELAKTGGVPESENHRQTLILINDIASTLIISYAIVFANYYEGSKYHYARHRKVMPELAACIFELLLLKQRARALRYQPQESADWSMANTVFHVMRAYEDVERPLQTLSQELKMDTARAKKSLADQYISLQVDAWFDLLRLPTRLQWVMGSYMLKVENAVQVRSDTGVLGGDELLVYCYGKNAAEIRRLETPAGPALVLDLHRLVEAIREDCQATRNANPDDASHVMPRFAHFETADHFVIRHQLLSCLSPKQNYAPASGEQQQDDLRIFAGLSAIFSMLSHRKSAFGSEDRLEDRLSKRSSTFAVDGREIRQSLWSVSAQTDGIIRFTTTESKDTTAMGIGMLLAFGSGDEIHRPRLAVVSRMFRPYGRALELDMRVIASFCESVVVGINAIKTHGLLVYDSQNGGHWALAIAPQNILVGIDKIEIHREKKVISVEVIGVLDASNDFYLLDTSLTSSQLGFYGAPQYAAPVAKQSNLRIF